MARESEFLSLDDRALRAVIGPSSRHVALIEDAFKVLIETPGGGVSINGSARDRAQAKRVVEDLAARADKGAEITEADVRAALGAAVSRPRDEGRGQAQRVVPDPVSLPVGRRGAIAPKTAAQARYVDLLGRCELTFGVGPAGTGKTFLAAAYGASLLVLPDATLNSVHMNASLCTQGEINEALLYATVSVVGTHAAVWTE